MDFDFTEEQQMLRDRARDFLSREFPRTLIRQMEEDPIGFKSDLWRKMGELGWTGLVIPGEYGGSGGSFMDLVVLLEEMGRACLIAPFFFNTICALLILDSGNQEQKITLLPRIASGKTIFTLALTEPNARYDPVGIATEAAPSANNYTLNGTKLFVYDAQVADYFLCAARTKPGPQPDEGVTLFIVDAKSPGLTILPMTTMAGDKQNEVNLRSVRVPRTNILGDLDRGWPVIDRIIKKAAVAKCAEMIGGADWTVESCVAYAKQRVQFGKPIGSFQVIQHYLADMWSEIGRAKRLVYHAAWLIDQGLPCAREVAMAKARMNDVYGHCTRMGIQVHGGIGTTRDHDMGLYYRRAKQAMPLFGNSDFWRERAAHEIGL